MKKGSGFAMGVGCGSDILGGFGSWDRYFCVIVLLVIGNWGVKGLVLVVIL